MFQRKQPLRHFLSCSAVLALALASPAAADTLREALVSSYRTNPTLNGQRESLRVNDAGVAIARAAGRPQVAATVGVNRDLTRSGVLDTGRSKGPIISGGVDLSVPLFQGGRVRNSVEAARTRVEAGRATLRAVEGDVFVQAVQAYMDVIRDRAIVELNRNQIEVLTTNLEATRDRFEIGDLTRTDVAQSEARLSLARSSLALAQGRLQSSEAFYRQVVGQAPGQLASPPPLPPLPATPEEAVRIALVENPDVIAVVRQAEAAGIDVRVAAADRLPTVSGVLSGDYVNTAGGNVGPFDRSGTQTSIGVNTRIPIYQGGLPSARIAQARALEGQLLERTIEIAVSAAQLALEGARAERSVGTRTVLDVLNAEQELLDAQVQLVSARRDQYVAGFQLLNAMGQAEADDLGLDGGPLYDPIGAYRQVAGQWNDWAGGKRYVPRSTRTVSPAEEPAGGQPATSVAGPPASSVAGQPTTGVTSSPR
jgi:outer membrane protein